MARARQLASVAQLVRARYVPPPPLPHFQTHSATRLVTIATRLKLGKKQLCFEFT
jgi:hypothetical protein